MIKSRILSTPVLLAPSNSRISTELPLAKSLQLGHFPQGRSDSHVQFSVRAKILTDVVLPTPRVPVKRKAW